MGLGLWLAACATGGASGGSGAVRISGDTEIAPDESTKAEVAAAGLRRLFASFKICMGTNGVPALTKQVLSSGFPDYDAKLVREMMKWRYRPYFIDGVPSRICTQATFVYNQGGQAPAIDVSLPAPPATLELISAGTGEKSPLRLTALRGSEQQIEMIHEAAVTAVGEPQLWTGRPFAVRFTGASEVTKVAPDGNLTYRTRLEEASAQLDGVAISPVGDLLVIDGVVSWMGSPKTTALASLFLKPTTDMYDLAALLHPHLSPWQIFPEEPLAVGAQWKVVMPELLSGMQTTVTTHYTLTARTDTTATVVGEIQLRGEDQRVYAQQARGITGRGRVEATFRAGRLYPTSRRTLHTEYRMTLGGGEYTVFIENRSSFAPFDRQWKYQR